MFTPSTLSDAKKRWASHTRHLLTADQRRDFKGKQWRVISGYNAAVGATLVLYFYVDEYGHTYASFTPPTK